MGDIEVAGVLIYTGTEAAAKQISALFCGSDLFKDLIDSNEISLRDVIDTMTTELK